MRELKTGLYADKFATFVAHSFCKWALYTLQSAKRK